MTWRKGHGKGAGQPRIETLPADELPPASPALTGATERTPDGRFARGNSAARAQRVRPGLRGLVGVDECSPDFRPFARWGARYASHRRSELAAAHGGTLSAGAGAIVESAALAMAASRYLDNVARKTGDPELFKQAAALGQTARGHELAAWELAAREAQARPKADPMAAARARIAAVASASQERITNDDVQPKTALTPQNATQTPPTENE